MAAYRPATTTYPRDDRDMSAETEHPLETAGPRTAAGSTARAAIRYAQLREAYRLLDEVRAHRPDLISEEVLIAVYVGSSKAWIEAGEP